VHHPRPMPYAMGRCPIADGVRATRCTHDGHREHATFFFWSPTKKNTQRTPTPHTYLRPVICSFWPWHTYSRVRYTVMSTDAAIWAQQATDELPQVRLMRAERGSKMCLHVGSGRGATKKKKVPTAMDGRIAWAAELIGISEQDFPDGLRTALLEDRGALHFLLDLALRPPAEPGRAPLK
jgi:hypothetical protein